MTAFDEKFNMREMIFIINEKNNPLPEHIPLNRKAMITVQYLNGKPVNNIFIVKCSYDHIEALSKRIGEKPEDVFIRWVVRMLNHEEMHRSLFRLEGLEASQQYDVLVGGKRETRTDTIGFGVVYNLTEKRFMEELVERNELIGETRSDTV